MIEMLIQLIVLLAIVGILYWVTTIIPLPPPLRIVAQVAVAIIAILLLCALVGWVPGWRFGHWAH